MRICIKATADFYPFHLDQFFSILDEEIKKYNWIFSDIEAYTFSEEEQNTGALFKKDHFIISGKELYSIINQNTILLIFGVAVGIKEDIQVVEAQELPKINENASYWDENYTSPVEEAEIEIGFFDTDVVVVTSSNLALISKFKKTAPNVISLEDYLKSN